MSATGPTLPSAAKIRDGQRDGAALVRVAREVREVIVADCESCARRVRREAIEGSDPVRYVHWHGGTHLEPRTCAPCTCEVDQGVLDDLDTVAEVGYWMHATTPIALPLSLPSGGGLTVRVGALSAPHIIG